MSDMIPEREYGFLEWHANSFAGLILVPPDNLSEVFTKYVDRAEGNDVDFNDTDSGLREMLEEYIAPEFKVSAAAIHRRVEYDALWNKR